MAPVAKNFKVKNGLDVAGTATATLFSGSGASLTSIPQSAITNLSTDLSAKAPLASPTFTGTLTAPTIVGTDTTDSSSKTTGALKTAGGLGVAKKIFSGTSMVAGGALVAQNEATSGYAVSYYNVASLNGSNLSPGAWVLTTPLPRAGYHMVTLRVHGFRYATSLIDFTVTFYTFGANGPDGVAGQIYSPKMIDRGTDGFNKYLGAKDGYVVLAIGDTGSTFAYPKLTVDAFITNSPNAYDTGWSWATTPNTTADFGWSYAPVLLTNQGLIVTNGTQTFPGIKTFSDTTDSSATTNGAVVVSGGVGIAKQLRVGTNLTVTSDISVAGTVVSHYRFGTGTQATDQTSDPKRLGVSWASAAQGNVSSAVLTAENSGNYGADYVFYSRNSGGGNIVERMRLSSSSLTLGSTTDSSSTSTGSIITSGGMGIAKSLQVGTGITTYGNASNWALVLENLASDGSTNVWRMSPTGSAWAAGDNKFVLHPSGSSADSLFTAMSSNYYTGIGRGNTAPASTLDVKSYASTDIGLIVKGAASQTANLQEWRDSTATVIASLSPSGAFTAVTKSFDIEHPTKPGQRLRYGSLEGPENGVYVRGRTSSDVIELPDYWIGLVDPDSITVQLTPIGASDVPYVVAVGSEEIGIHNPGECFYFIQAERIDVGKLVVEYGN